MCSCLSLQPSETSGDSSIVELEDCQVLLHLNPLPFEEGEADQLSEQSISRRRKTGYRLLTHLMRLGATAHPSGANPRDDRVSLSLPS